MKRVIQTIVMAAGLLSAAAAVQAAEIVIIVNPANPATAMTPTQASQFSSENPRCLYRWIYRKTLRCVPSFIKNCVIKIWPR
jgi:hypothetical protein